MENHPEQQHRNDTPEQQHEDDAFDAFLALGEKLRTPEVQRIIDGLIELHDPNESHDPSDVLLKYGKDSLPDDYYVFLEMYAKLGVIFETQDTPGDSPDAEIDVADNELAAYILEEARELLYASGSIQLSQGGYTEDEQRAIGEAREDLQRIVRDSNLSDESLEVYYDLLERSRTVLISTHILESRTEQFSNEYDINELHLAYELNERYRPGYVQLHPDAAQSRRLLPTHYWQVEMTDEIRNHLEDYLRSIDSGKEIARLDIKGLERLPFSLDADEIRDFLKVLPGVTFDGVTGIHFKDRPPENRHIKTDEANGRWAILAEHQHNFESNDSRINMGADAISNYYQMKYNESLTKSGASNDSEFVAHDTARVATIEYIKETLVHEFGHALLNRLPVALLNDWDSAVFESLNDQPVSRYVEVSDTLQEGSYPIEDFAESFMLGILHPDQLRDCAPDRAVAMQAVIRSCRP